MTFGNRQAELLESEPALRAQAQAAEKAKLEALERKLGINAAESSEDGSKRKIEDVDLAELARKKHKFEDNKFLEESREINDNVRSAVSAGKYPPSVFKCTLSVLTHFCSSSS